MFYSSASKDFLSYNSELDPFYNICALVMVVTIICIAVLGKRARTSLISVPMKLFVGIGLPVGSAVIVFFGNYVTIAGILGSVLTGFFSGVLSMQWIYALRRLGMHDAIASFPLLLCVSVCICSTTLWLPNECVAVIIVILPAISELLLHSGRKAPLPEYDFDAPREGMRSKIVTYFVIGFLMAIYSFAEGFFDSRYFYSEFYYGISFIIIILGVTIYLIVVEKRAFLNTVGTPFGVMCVALIPVIASAKTTFPALIIDMNMLAMEPVLFVLSVGLAEMLVLDALKTFVILRSCFAVFTAPGLYIARILLETTSSPVILFITVLLMLICVIILCIAIAYYGMRSKLEMAKESKLQEKAPEPERSSIYTDISEKYGLSARESEVMMLLAQGHSYSDIQGILFIAPGTVNYHCRNVYRKMGVNSKQQLVHFVERFDSDS